MIWDETDKNNVEHNDENTVPVHAKVAFTKIPCCC